MTPRSPASAGTSVQIAVGIVALLAFVAVAAPWIAPFDPTVSAPDIVADKLLPPSASHLLGTDAIARDLLSRMIHGTRVSLLTAFLCGFVVLVVGVTWGGVAGIAPPVVDRWMMRFVDALLATPRLLIVLAVVAFTERLSPPALAVLLGLTAWPLTSRVVRERVREIAVSDYVAHARALGTPERAILAHHILPGVAPVALVGVVTTIAGVIPLEAALSYFNAGVAPPAASWGSLLQDATSRPLEAWWLLLFPSLAIALTVLSVSIIGEHLQRRDGRAVA
jgi:peptide/nickel transport system permease protein